jgi:hypothetical protein
MEEESNTPEPMGDWLSETKNWIQDNIRIVLSIVMVLIIGVSVYSYSKKGLKENQEENTDQAKLEDLVTNEEQAQPEDKAGVIDDAKKIAQEEAVKKTEEQAVTQEKKEEPEPEPAAAETEKNSETVVSQNQDGYEVTAGKGDSLTTISRSAVKQYIETNQDSEITNEHRVYMEDYLAKKMGYNRHLNAGEVKSFSADNMKEALDAAKKLTPQQLEHLKIYSQRVSSF